MSLWKRLLRKAWRKQADQLKQDIALLSEQSKYKQALPLAEQLYDLVRHHQQENPLEYIATLIRLYHDVGDYAKAEPLLQQVLKILRAALGEQHPAVALSLNTLAGLYREMGDYAKAEPLYQQALEMRQEMLGEQHPDVATSLNNLALLYSDIGDFAKAEPLVQQALEILANGVGRAAPRCGHQPQHPGRVIPRDGGLCQSRAAVSASA